MNILVTGAKGFVGKNMVANLQAIADGRNRTRPNLQIVNIYEYDIDSTREELEQYCKSALTSRDSRIRSFSSRYTESR